MREAGFEDVVDDVVSSDRAPETRREGTRVEYEVLVTKLRMAKDLGVKHLRVHSDSQLIVR